MKKSFKKTLSIILTILMIVTAMPVALAATTPAAYDGVPVTPEKITDFNYTALGIKSADLNTYRGFYAIRDAKELYGFAELVNGGEADAKAVVLQDIVVNETVSPSGAAYVWTPIGSIFNPYRGVFDGNGHTISGLYRNNIKEEGVGLFGTVGVSANGIDRIRIENVVLANSCFRAGYDVGAIAGCVLGNYVDISNCKVESDVTIFCKLKAGGIAGNIYDVVNRLTVFSEITDCIFFGKLISEINWSYYKPGSEYYIETEEIAAIVSKWQTNENSQEIFIVNNCYYARDCIEASNFDINVTVYKNIGKGGETAAYNSNKGCTVISSPTDSHTCVIAEQKGVDATCVYPGLSGFSFCLICGRITSGANSSTEAIGHNWQEATCTEPKTCKRCKLTDGPVPDGHRYSYDSDGNMVDGKCLDCGDQIHISVEDIAGKVIENVTPGTYTLPSDVVPANATRKNIVWTVESGNATVSGNTLNLNGAGTVVIKATVTKGGLYGIYDWTQTYTINVFDRTAINPADAFKAVIEKHSDTQHKVTEYFLNGDIKEYIMSLDTPVWFKGAKDGEYTIELKSGSPNMVLEDFSITNGQIYICSGANPTLTLTGNNFIAASYGRNRIEIENGARLTVEGTGSLTLGELRDNVACAISGGELVINNGTVIINEGANGKITINGGTVTAKAIKTYSNGALSGTVTINGGTVTATGASEVPAINGTVNITGGTVTATGAYRSAGIGGGLMGDGGTVNISGGTVTATGGSDAAGIGGGYLGNNGMVNISGGTVIATGGSSGAGIGGGANGSGGTVNISGGTVTATGGSRGAGIGGGYWGDGGTVIITGGNVKAAPGRNAYTAIGGGYSSESNGTLTDGNGENVYLNTITLITLDEQSAVKSLVGASYGLNDVNTLDTNKLYFYLPASADITSVTDEDGTEYVGTLVGTTAKNGDFCLRGHNFEWVTVVDSTCYKTGYKHQKCLYCGAVKEGDIYTYAEYLCRESYPETEHPRVDSDVTYISTGAKELRIKFNSQTEVYPNYDYIRIYDGKGASVGVYTGSELSGKEITVSGDTVRIHMDAYSAKFNVYGYSIDYIYETVPVSGEFIRMIPMKKHQYSDGVCTVCNAEHICNLSDEWKHDSEGHWKECVDADCEKISEEGIHSFTDGVCSVCEYNCPHQTYTDGVCDNCGIVCTHSYGEGVLTRPESVTSTDWVDGYYTYTCDICGDSYNETVKRADYTQLDKVLDDFVVIYNDSTVLDSVKSELDSIYDDNRDVIFGNRIESEQDQVDAVAELLADKLDEITAGIEDGTATKADYTEIDEAMAQLNEELGDVNLTDEAKAGLEEIKAQLEEMKADENTSKSDLAELEKALGDYETELEKGIKDGSAVKVDGEEFWNECLEEISDELAEKYDKEEFKKFAEDLLDEVVAGIEKRTTAIYNEMTSLEGSLKDNEEKLAELKAELEAVFDELGNCFTGAHNGLKYEVSEEAECGKNAVESATCTLCGETVTREVEKSALTHSFTKYETVEEAECGKAGKEVAYCDHACGATDEKEIEALEHVFVDYIYNEDATCTADGTKTATCLNGCGETDTVTAEDTMLEHADEDEDGICDGCNTEIKEKCPDCGGAAHEGEISEYICLIIMFVKLVISLLRAFNLTA